jgi:G3E family GTPase
MSDSSDFADRIGLNRTGPITREELTAIHKWRDESLERIGRAKEHVDDAITKHAAGAKTNDVLDSLRKAKNAMRSNRHGDEEARDEA